MEQAIAYATNSSDIYKNIADKYANKDSATNNNISLYRQKSQNSSSAKTANEYLGKVASQYNTILSDDKNEINEYSKKVNSAKKTIKKSNSSLRGKNYANLSKKSKAKVDKFIDSIQKTVKSGKAIGTGSLATLSKYYANGDITLKFYQSCIDYNNALESKRQAEAQYEIDKETAKTEKASIGSQMIDNIEQEYSNKLNKNAAKTTSIQTAQSLKKAKGLSLTKGDYTNLINQSKIDQKIYSDEASAIDSQIKQNLKKGYWTTSSQEYKDAINSLAEYKK